jgi:tetratricopeptide (TPR) repeat protein
MRGRATDSALRDAERALGAVMADPRRARISAQAALTLARSTGDAAAHVVAERALGLAARELHDTAKAAVHLRRSVRVAESHGLHRRAAESRMSLSLVVDDLGRPADAVREIDRAIEALTGLPLARARMQRAIILRRLGRDEEALVAYGRALTSFRRAGDRLWEARVLTNRGVLHAYQGALRQAEADLRRAEALYADLGQHAALAQVRHNLGFAAAQAGDVPAALAWYDRADEHFRRHGRPAVALLDRAELLLVARLWPEAREAAQAAAEASLRTRMGSVLPQARLLEAQAALAADDPAGARSAAAAAYRSFTRQGRRRWAALADYISWRASDTHQRPTPSRLARARAVADALAGAGWDVHALDARLLAAEAAVALVDKDKRATDLIAATMAELARTVAVIPPGPARLRTRAWYGRAVTRLYEGDRTGAKRALIKGLRIVDAYRATFGATELRVHSSAEGADASALGLRLAMMDQRPREVLAWAERSRAATLQLAPSPVSSAELAGELARLRRVNAELSTMEPDPSRLRRLLRRQKALEDSIRQQTWRTPGVDDHGPSGRSLGAVVAALGSRALLELVEYEGTLHAVVVADGRVRLQALGDTADVRDEAVALRFALRRLTIGQHSPRSRQAATEAAEHGVRRLDALIMAPIRRLVDDRPLVVVPTGALHALPWPVLPSCRGRALTVAPSAGLWRRAVVEAGAGAGDGPEVLVAPPAPPHAATEVEAIGAQSPAATRFVGAEARVPAVLAALDGARVAHVAAHGSFRVDNPMFSHLLLADGSLTVHDLMQIRRPPALLVLSACDAGLSTSYPGDELMGFASAVLGLGTPTLVASVGVVDDAATAPLMADLHARLRGGATPAEALAQAQSSAENPHISIFNFVCFGAG